MTLDQQIKKLIKERVKTKKRLVKTNIFSLDCDICSDKRVKLDGNDFESWDKDMWNKKHLHRIKRIVGRWIK